jgi:hypothetical protein
MLTLILLFSSNDYAEAIPTSGTVEAEMYFKVTFVLDGYGTKEKPFSDEAVKPIPHARLIVIDSNGFIAANGLTNKKGEWSVKINTPIDPRFQIKKMGVVTVITVADGFNEFIKFNVPVNENGDGEGTALITLRRIRPDVRNEPSFDAAFHRFTVFGMLDYYANQIGLAKQEQIKGADGFGEVDMPWSAKLK